MSCTHLLFLVVVYHSVELFFVYHLEKASFTQYHWRCLWHFQDLKFFYSFFGYCTLLFLIWRQLDLNSSHIYSFFLYRKKKERSNTQRQEKDWSMKFATSWKYFTTKKRKIHKWYNNFYIKMLMFDCCTQHMHVGQHLLLMMRQLEVLI